jgi:poly-gamma-glutamate synthesis protein (capsule biosynthesis protein)
MSNKYLFFPFFGILLPLCLYFFFDGFKQSTEIPVLAVGEVDSDEVIATSKKSQEIVFTGDVLMARHVEELMKRNGETYPFISVASIFAGAEAIIGNFESAILKNHIQTPSYVTTFSVDAKLLPQLRQAGFTHLSLANNHSFDYGGEAYDNAVSVLASNQLSPVGHPQNSSSTLSSTFTSGDYTIGMVALNQVFNTLPWSAIEQSLTELTSTTDYQIAYIHWGDEYVLKHNQTQEDTAKRLIDLGIDAVIGHHPHVTQDIQIYNNKPIFYYL